MADITIKLIEPADSYDLCTLEEMKVMLGIAPTNTTEDELLALWITQYSDVIATMCNRVFAKEKVAETWRGDTPPFDIDNSRIFLSHWPVVEDDIETITGPDGVTIDVPGYVIESRSGKLQFFGSSPTEPITITYSGGYDLPDDAPPALKQALAIMVSAARVMKSREMTAGVRSISHRESRVQFFDVNAAMAKQGGGGPLAVAGETVTALLYHYMRFNV